MIIRKSAQEIAKMAAAGRVVAETIAHVGEQLEPGVTTGELDRIAEEYIRSRGGTPTSQGYRGFPGAICISPNAMVVHGIPGPYEVAEGDLITIDVGVTLDGYIADSAFTFAVGEVERAGAAPARHRPRRARRRDRPGACPGTGSATSRRPSSTTSRAPASRSSAASSGTASAAPTTRTRTSRTSASPAAGRCSPRG